MIKNVTIGADPELFIIALDGSPYPVIGLIGGTKAEPIPIGEGCSLQEDNVLAEYCIPPVTSKEDFWKYISYCQQAIRERLNGQYGIFMAASMRFSAEHLYTPEAMTMGCSPDFNAYTLKTNPPGNSASLFRSAGFHIHVGYDNPNFDLNIKLVKAMDLFLGLPSILLDRDLERRKLYGKAGCFRPKDYGTEYRVLSGYFTSSESLVHWVFENTMKAIDFVNSDKRIAKEDEALIVEGINSGNVEIAELICTEYKVDYTPERKQQQTCVA